MSQAKIQARSRARKPYKCGKCGDEIAVGQPYRYFIVGFRGSYKGRRVRCMKASCTPTRAERESSNLADYYDALDTAAGRISAADAGNTEELTEALSDATSQIEDVQSQYEEAGEHFGGQGEAAERAEMLAEALDALGQYDAEDNDCEEHGESGFEEACDACDSWWRGQVEAAESALADAEVL